MLEHDAFILFSRLVPLGALLRSLFYVTAGGDLSFAKLTRSILLHDTQGNERIEPVNGRPAESFGRIR